MTDRRRSSGEERRDEKEREEGEGGGERIEVGNAQEAEADSGKGQESSRLTSKRNGARGDVDDRVSGRTDDVCGIGLTWTGLTWTGVT